MRLAASWASWMREVRPSLAYTCVRCVCTVRGDTKSCAAISLLPARQARGPEGGGHPPARARPARPHHIDLLPRPRRKHGRTADRQLHYTRGSDQLPPRRRISCRPIRALLRSRHHAHGAACWHPGIRAAHPSLGQDLPTAKRPRAVAVLTLAAVPAAALPRARMAKCPKGYVPVYVSGSGRKRVPSSRPLSVAISSSVSSKSNTSRFDLIRSGFAERGMTTLPS